MKNKVYIVFEHDWDRIIVLKVFDNEAVANEYLRTVQKLREDSEMSFQEYGFWIESYDVDSIYNKNDILIDFMENIYQAPDEDE